MQFEFLVSGDGRHQVRFRYSRLTNTVRIDVDGEVVEKDAFRAWIPATRRYEFVVGRTDRRAVIIDMAIPRAWAKFRVPECRVTVDGRSPGGSGDSLGSYTT